jgi:hypothetical protein
LGYLRPARFAAALAFDLLFAESLVWRLFFGADFRQGGLDFVAIEGCYVGETRSGLFAFSNCECRGGDRDFPGVKIWNAEGGETPYLYELPAQNVCGGLAPKATGG